MSVGYPFQVATNGPDWPGIIRHRQLAAAELAALGAVEGEHVAGSGDDEAPAAGEEPSWLARQLAKLEALRDSAESQLKELGDKARGGVKRAARGVARSAKRGLSAARSVTAPGDSIGEKLKKGFKSLLAWSAVYAGGGVVLNIAILYGLYKLLSDDRVQSAARSYYSRR